MPELALGNIIRRLGLVMKLNFHVILFGIYSPKLFWRSPTKVPLVLGGRVVEGEGEEGEEVMRMKTRTTRTKWAWEERAEKPEEMETATEMVAVMVVKEERVVKAVRAVKVVQMVVVEGEALQGIMSVHRQSIIYI